MQDNTWAGTVVGILKPLRGAQDSWEGMGVDIMTAMPTSLKGNDCIETFEDNFSKW
jgi:hypothetical protein